MNDDTAYASDELPDDAKVSFKRVARKLPEELTGPRQLRIKHREIGNGPQFSLQVYDTERHVIWWDSYWFGPEEIEAYLDGMAQFGRVMDEMTEE